MYFVPVSAAACDEFQSTRPGPTPQTAPKTGLKLVTCPMPPPAEPGQGPKIDPQTLAAKILDLHAASADENVTACRRPKLADGPEGADAHDFDMPGILKRRAPKDTSDAALQDTSDTGPAEVHRGPGFKSLLAGTLVIAAGSAVLLGIVGFPGGRSDTLTVTTQSIATAPTIEGLIEADATTRQDARAAGPSPAQIVSAKVRIQEAFAASATSGPRSGPGSALNRTETEKNSKIQARLTLPRQIAAPVSVPPAPGSSPEAAATGTRAVTAAATSRQSALPEPEITGPVQGRPSTSVVADGGIGTTRAAAAQKAGGPASNTYPNTGKITASVNLRQSADKDAAVLTVVPAGTSVTYDTCGTWWCGIAYQGQQGFVGQKFLERAQ